VRPLPKVSLTGSVERGYSIWFVMVVALFLTSLLVSNIIAAKIISVGGLVLSSAIIIFPVSYIIGDVLTEVYGYRRARLVIWIGFACNLLVVLIISAAIAMPPAPFYEHQEAFATVLGVAPRLDARVADRLLGGRVHQFLCAGKAQDSHAGALALDAHD
jgi:uncharacterized PurR-regulated membrane protein YhhQ (DUF165 family)